MFNNKNNIFNNNVFNNNNNRNYEDNSKYIDLGRQWGISKSDDVFSDPFNPKWYIDDKKEYSEKDIDTLNQTIKNYCESNKGRKNFLEYCDENSETLATIRKLNQGLNGI